jgi:uncharacterized membrane protein
MGKFFVLTGCFLTGVSAVGLFSYTAYAFERLRMYGFWLSVCAALLLLASALADDFIAESLGLTYQQFIGWMVATVAILILGGVVQWVH